MNYTGFGVGLLFLVVFGIFFGTYVGGLVSLYPTENLNGSKSETYQRIGEVANITGQLSAGVEENNPSDEEFDQKVYTQGFAGIKLIFFSGPSMISAMLNDFSREIGLPTWVVGFVLSLIVLMLVLFLFTIFTRSFLRL